MQFPDLFERLAEVRVRIAEAQQRGGHGQEVRVIAVTKTHNEAAVREAAAQGITDIGENKVQEALGKQESLTASGTMPQGIAWHLIGHLQTNKVKALPSFSLFHAMDRARLADAASAVAQKLGLTFDVLLQVNVIGEETKGGFAPSEVSAEADRLMQLPGLRVCGVMTMAPFDAEERELRRVFTGAREARDVLRAAGHPAAALSMGMSGDYEIAVEEGATLVRLGTVLFGSRS
jgi:PLP dependent protein